MKFGCKYNYIDIKFSQLRNTAKCTKSQIITRPRLGLCINRDIPRQRREDTANLKNRSKGLPRFTFLSIYILCLLTLFINIDYQANRRGELFFPALQNLYDFSWRLLCTKFRVVSIRQGMNCMLGIEAF
jgi:hypothetical protein